MLEQNIRRTFNAQDESLLVWHEGAAIVLGDRAVAIALASGLEEKFKNLLREARPYVEGRGIRFDVISADDVLSVVELIRIKATPK